MNYVENSIWNDMTKKGCDSKSSKWTIDQVSCYHYFTRKDEECSEYNTFDKKYHDQLNEMQAEIYRIAEKIGELDEDINLENIYGLGRLKATDPELRSLAIMQSKDDDIRNEFNTLLEKLIVLKKK